MPNKVAEPINHSSFRLGDYVPKELGRTVHRPGAYDAFSKPSLIGGQRVPYRVTGALSS